MANASDFIITWDDSGLNYSAECIICPPGTILEGGSDSHENAEVMLNNGIEAHVHEQPGS